MQGGPVLEGGELSVLEDLQLPFIRRRLIQNIVVEMSDDPGVVAPNRRHSAAGRDGGVWLEFGMWAYTQNAPDTRVPAIKLTHFIRTRHTETAPAAECAVVTSLLIVYLPVNAPTCMLGCRLLGLDRAAA